MNVLIADDHPLVRDALARTVQALDAEVVVQQVSDYAGVLQALDQAISLPELLLLDLHMPGMGGVDGVRRLRQAHPSQRLVVASGEEDPGIVRSVMALGVAGFLPKSEAAEVLVQALQLVLSGGTYLPPMVLGDLRPGQVVHKPDASGLTQRQREVLRLLMQGQPNKLIARALGLTEGTVKIHIAAILRVLQARNRTEAVVVARDLGLQA